METLQRSNKMNYLDCFRKNGFHNGRMISGSKSGYMKKNPKNKAVFNARIALLGEGVIWWGDLDITKDEENLKKIASEIGKPLYVLYESDAWNEDAVTDQIILDRNVVKIEQ
jgi:hypothetical protein